MRKDYRINENVSRIIQENDKRPGKVADKAGIRRDVFSRILHSKRPIYADELIPITRALGVSLEEVIAGIR